MSTHHMLIAAALTALAPLGATAGEYHDLRAADDVYLEAGTHLGAIGGGAFDYGPSMGIRAALGVWLDPDLALQVAVGAHGDLMVHGYGADSVSLGVAWFASDMVRLEGGLRYRRFSDDVGFAEAMGSVIGSAIGAAFCGGAPDCRVEADPRLDVEDAGLELGIASQVQWSVFTFGVEWIGFYQPLTLFDARWTARTEEGLRSVHAPGFEVTDLPREYRFLTLNFGASF